MFRTKLAKVFATREEEEFAFTNVLELINEGLSTDQLFGTAEATAACNTMADADEIMYYEGVVHKI